MAVFDSRLRVRGVAGLRVADASVIRSIVGSNIKEPTIMIGENAAAMILNEALQRPDTADLLVLA